MLGRALRFVLVSRRLRQHYQIPVVRLGLREGLVRRGDGAFESDNGVEWAWKAVAAFTDRQLTKLTAIDGPPFGSTAQVSLHGGVVSV